ncbi:hypothetical protein [Stenotrophomonas rhizophila]|uniref:hypothetical protein n=1 Tax=Stenotrophomonas rhizophila TaxID=216778 RepID=UPI001E395C92|nr:hypothetical protein [Stenotrophomonas rhizophila]MCC7634184.1 hypothetical protein [Stenotrophomonas rhizophila]MCC7662880.1 hypothetical protein [Stenotrophomonas rhizophila]
MELRPLYPHAVSPHGRDLRRAACCGLARTLLLHGLGAHPAEHAALKKALRASGSTARCADCLAGTTSRPAALRAPHWRMASLTCSAPAAAWPAPAPSGLPVTSPGPCFAVDRC